MISQGKTCRGDNAYNGQPFTILRINLLPLFIVIDALGTQVTMSHFVHPQEL